MEIIAFAVGAIVTTLFLGAIYVGLTLAHRKGRKS